MHRRQIAAGLAIVGILSGCLLAQPVRGADQARDGLVLEYCFEGSAADSSGGKHDGAIHGRPRFVPGRIGQCLEFDGQQDYVDSGTTLADLGQTFTVECWVNPAERQNPHADIFGNHNHGGFGFAVEQDADNANRFAGAYGAGNGRWISAGPVSLAAGKWQHLALVKTPGELRLVINGIPAAVARSDAPMLPSPLTLRVGGSLADVHRCFRGRIDQFRVWKKALSEFDLGLSPEERLSAFAQAVHIDVRSLAASRPGGLGRASWGLSLDKRLLTGVPKEIQEIVLAMEAEPWRSESPVALPPVKLIRESGFKAEFSPPLRPDYYRVRYRPSIVAGSRQVAGAAGEFSCAVDGPLAAAATEPPQAPEVARFREKEQPSKVIPLEGEGWLIAVDPKNQGRQQKWHRSPVKDARRTKVPWVIQDVFPEYHGVVWYWRDFMAPAHFDQGGRYLLRFHAVDYLADVWVNGVPVGGHEGGETPFVLDATQAVKPGQANRLAVRVLNPTYEPIDGIALKQTPSGAKQYPLATNSTYNCGGILDAVELLLVPSVRIEDLHVIPDWTSGEIRVRTNVRSAASKPIRGLLQWSVAPAASGEALDAASQIHLLVPGDTLVEARLRVAGHRLWRLGDPYLYRVTGRVQAQAAAAFDERSVRCGFRDFRFTNGYFRLNGERIFLHGNINVAHHPIGYTFAPDPDMLRRDVLMMKALGINLCRFAFGGAMARQLDIFDELGVMVYMEHYASWQLQDSPQMKRRYERSLGEIVLRDRNHPSIVAWGMLNETGPNDPAFRHGLESLALVRWLDPGRMCIFNSGRWDGDYNRIGSLSNPGSPAWESDLRDVHGYPDVPHRGELLRSMRTARTPEGLWSGAADRQAPDAPEHPIFVSEYGQCGAVDLARVLRRFEQAGEGQCEEGRYYRRQMDKFLADWQAWQLGQIWARPEDFFLESHANFAKLRRIGENALRANPHLVAFSSTYPIAESAFCGSGVTNAFRELKPGLADAAFELAAPLRWCLFAEPVHVYRGTRVKLEAVLANEDALRPGRYPARFQVVGPKGARLWEKTIAIEVPRRSDKKEPPFAQLVFSEEVAMDGASGRYRFLATLLEGGAPQGGETELYVTDPAEMPPVDREVVLWGDDAELRDWLARNGIRTRPFSPGQQTAREVILACQAAPAPRGAQVYTELAQHIARGSNAVFLDPAILGDGRNPTRWLPLVHKGLLAGINWVGGYYRADPWAKAHPIFEGLPSGGLMDPVFYREILPQNALLRCYTVGRGFVVEEATAELDEPAEAVCGSNRLSANYASGLHVAVYRLGEGRFIMNNLRVRENLGRVPAADRLLRNMLNYAGRQTDKPPAALSADFATHLKAIGYGP